jgi:adenylate kinase
MVFGGEYYTQARKQTHGSTMFIVLFGAPGCGKGTQAEGLSRRLGLPHIASGDLFREHVFQKTKLGSQIETYILKGSLIPDTVTVSVLQERLLRPDALNGAILDGFPRTLNQARALDDLLMVQGKKVNIVLFLKVPDEEIVDRLSGRLICRECQSPFHKIYKPFVSCPYNKCKGEHLYQRRDDKADTVRARLKTFHKQTAPLIDYYEKKKLLKTISGSDSLEKVQDRVVAALEQV